MAVRLYRTISPIIEKKVPSNPDKLFSSIHSAIFSSPICLKSMFRGKPVFIEKIIRNSGEFKVKLGRGKSRGYGHATVKVREIRLEKKYYITDEKVIPLVAESPLATFKVKDSGLYSFPEPPGKIKLSSFTLKSLGLDENVELQIKRHPDYGKLIFSPSKVQVSGWCLRTEMSKIRFTAAAPGTVAIYEAINGKIEDIENIWRR